MTTLEIAKSKGYKPYFDERQESYLKDELTMEFALLISWIRENFGIHISVHHWTNQPVGDDLWKDCYQGFVNGDAMDVHIFKTHEETEDRTLLYTLQNLIP